MGFRTTFYDRATGDEITKPSLIAKKYIRSGFPLDFLATLSIIPSVVYTGAFADVLSGFGLLKVFRITRISQIIDKLTISATEK